MEGRKKEGRLKLHKFVYGLFFVVSQQRFNTLFPACVCIYKSECVCMCVYTSCSIMSLACVRKCISAGLCGRARLSLWAWAHFWQISQENHCHILFSFVTVVMINGACGVFGLTLPLYFSLDTEVSIGYGINELHWALPCVCLDNHSRVLHLQRSKKSNATLTELRFCPHALMKHFDNSVMTYCQLLQ